MRRANTPSDFWALVDRGAAKACWPWCGPRRHRGIGRFTLGAEQWAHRIAWLLTHGPTPASQFVGHLCGNRLCCNPGHLCAVSRAVFAQGGTRGARARALELDAAAARKLATAMEGRAKTLRDLANAVAADGDGVVVKGRTTRHARTEESDLCRQAEQLERDATGLALVARQASRAASSLRRPAH